MLWRHQKLTKLTQHRLALSSLELWSRIRRLTRRTPEVSPQVLLNHRHLMRAQLSLNLRSPWSASLVACSRGVIRSARRPAAARSTKSGRPIDR